jgi:hypothetical protein
MRRSRELRLERQRAGRLLLARRRVSGRLAARRSVPRQRVSRPSSRVRMQAIAMRENHSSRAAAAAYERLVAKPNARREAARSRKRWCRGWGLDARDGDGCERGGSAEPRTCLGGESAIVPVAARPSVRLAAFTAGVSGIRAGSARAVRARSRPCWRSHRR